MPAAGDAVTYYYYAAAPHTDRRHTTSEHDKGEALKNAHSISSKHDKEQAFSVTTRKHDRGEALKNVVFH